MSLYQSPKIVTDGLVFYYDMNNPQKSWKGRPITNLVDPSWSSWSIDGSGQGNIGTRTIDASYECTIVDNNANTRQNIYISSGITASTTYTFSVQYKKNYGTPTLRFQIQAYNGPTYLSTISFPTTAQLGILDIDGWQTAKITVTTPASTNRILWFMQDGDDYVAYTHSFSLKNVQCEQNSFATPFVDGTRSTSDAVLDLTGNNTVTANSLTYAADGTFSFNGTNDKLTLGTNTLLSSGQSYTIDVVFKTSTAGGVDYIFGNYGSGNSAGLEYYVYQNRLNNYISGNTQSATNLNANQWYIASVVRNGTTVTHYLNGQPDGSSTNGAAIATNNPFTIGNGHDYTSEAFGGNIAAIKVYNRALSPAEVQQNFNAQRSRYTGYQTMTYTAISNVTLTNNGTQEVSMFKISDNNVWNGEVRSTEGFSAPCTIEFSKQAASGDNGVSYAMIGWNEDPTSDTSYGSIDHASYPYITSNYHVYNNGSGIGLGLAWDVNKRFYIVYDTDGFIRHYNGSTLLYSANYGTNKTVYVDSSLYSVNSTFGGFSNVKVARSSWNGTNYV